MTILFSMKKALKIIGITLFIFIAILVAVPFVFQSQIKGMVKNFINENVHAHVEFSDVSLSFIRSFPQAHVTVSDLNITNFEPFKDETFLTAKHIAFTMSVKELFKTADEPIVVNSITIDEALVTLKTDSFGNVNYDIAKDSKTETESDGFSFDIDDYSINNSALTYLDLGTKMKLYISELNHSGSGTFSGEISELDTETEANVSFEMDSTNYLKNTHIKLDALIGMDLENSKYTFKDNTGYINKLPIEFKGFVQLLEEGQEVDITFENPESSFKNFLAVIPETYSKNIENVETTGDFKVKGIIKGKVTEETIPTLDIRIVSNNASFKYPDLPKRVENIVINTEIKNETGYPKDTYVDIKTLNFKIDNDVFNSSATIKNITENMLVNANVDGVLNLGNITKAYPVDLDSELSGILRAKVNTSFDMNAIETNAYDRIKASGNANITDFIFTSDAMNHPFHISKADMTFNPSTVTLNAFNAKTGKSDIAATGTISNLIGFMLSKKADLKGQFNVSSNTFALNDFMSDDTETTSKSDDNKSSSKKEAVKIPAFLDCTIHATAANVLYDNLNLKNVKGTLIIKDQQASIQNLTSDLFDGKLALSGNVNTQTDLPTFSMNMNANAFDIAQSFNGLEMLQNIAPIAKALQGKLNSTINLSGALTNEMTPNLKSVTGNAYAELLTTKIDKSSPLVSKLDGALSFVDFDKLNLNNLKANLDFSDGKVNVKPINLAYQDIGIEISGSHSFENTMSYDAVFNVPAKYLGGEVNQLIGKINDDEVNNITIPVTANIGGTFTNPQVKTDLTSGVSNLTKQLVEIEKQKIIGQGKDKIKDLLGGLSGNNTDTKTETDTTKTNTTTTKKDEVKEGVKNVLGGLLGGKKKKKDSVN